MERYDIRIQRGATLRRVVRFLRDGVPVDLTGYSASCQVRETPDGGRLVAVVNCAVSPQEGRVELGLDADATAGMESGSYVWDLRLTAGDGFTGFYVGGGFVVLPSVTE